MRITIVLVDNNRIYSSPIDRDEVITFGTGKKDTVYVEGFITSEIEVRMHFDTFSVSAKKIYGVEEKNLPMDSFVVLDKSTKTLIYASAVSSEKTSALKLPFNCTIHVGRSSDNDVVLSFPFISGHHFTLRNEAGIVRVEDKNSSNGVYLNGRRVGIARMNSGDILSLMSIQIKLLNGVLYFYNAGNRIQIQPGFEDEAHDMRTHAALQTSHLLYRRSPRALEKMPSEDILLASAPTKAQKFEKGRGSFSSLIGSGAMMAGSLAMGITSPALMAARAASLVAPVAGMATNKSSNKKRKKKSEQYEAMRREKYGAYIESQKARIDSVAKVQRQIVMRANPNIAECLGITTGLRRNLWERTPADSDFLDVRVGMGYEPLCVAVKARQESSSFQMEDDEVKALTDQIIEETKIVDNVPARVSLGKYASFGIVGNRDKEIQLVKNMLISLCTSHCYEDVRIVGIFDESERHIWEPLKWLPHIWDDNKQFRYLAFGKQRAHAICETISDLITARQSGSDQSYFKKQRQLPHYVLIFGSKEIVEKENVMRSLFQADVSDGITSLFVFNDLYSLPHYCRFIIDVDNNPCAYDSTAANDKAFFTMDQPLSIREFDAFARRMSAIELDGFSKKAGIPDSVTFLDGFGVERVEQLNALARWSSSQPYNTLAAPIGVLSGDETFYFDIHEKAYGPHGLVAGTTGSGKSEILQTWILSMALTYHPHDVVFVLIDYKGGGMASLLEPLPHVVGKITNIGSNIGRSLISLQSEIKRRQRLFDEAGVNHIDKYQRLYKNGMTAEPLPHLIIVADEFAELKKEEPEFMSGLISASRVGRSLGVHLVLATQKPGGIVDDQIQSNSRFRLCLKVQDITDSREMIKRPDAARLTRPGRAYIRVGEDEYFDLFQSYYSGAPYIEQDRQNDKDSFDVSFVDIDGSRSQLVQKSKKASSDKDELQAVVEYIVRTAEQQRIKALDGPWLPELPEVISLRDLDQDMRSASWPQLPVGIYDNPKAQQQGIQKIDFSVEGHYAVYGTSGTGKTTLIKTILFGIGRYYDPTEITAYIIDAGGWSLSAFSSMPNVGGVALDSEEEKINKLQTLITEEFERRKKLFLKNAVSSLKAYREDVSADLPAIVIAVDNIVPLFELYPDIESFFTNLARDGATYGIYLLYTANSTSGVRYKIVQNIRGAIAFELTDKGDYPTIVGRPEEGLAKITGRAFYKGNPPVVFQAAVPFTGVSDREANDMIRQECMRLSASWNGPRPKTIPVMPEHFGWEMMNHAFAQRFMAPAGMAYDTVEPVAYDLSERYSLLITGPSHCGKSKMLFNMMRYLTDNTENTRLIVLDSKSGKLSESKKDALLYAVDNDEEKVSEMMTYLVDQLNTRKKQQMAAKKSQPALDEKEYALRFDQLAVIIDDLKEFVDEVSDTNRNTMERICRMAENLGVIVICGGRVSDISQYNEIESLTRVIVANQNATVLAGSPAQYPFLRSNLKYSEKEIEAGEGNGFMFADGSCRKIKLPV